MTTRHDAAIAVACSVLEKAAIDGRERAAAAHDAEERVILRAKVLEDKLASAISQLDLARAQVEHLEKEISSAHSTHKNEVAHMRNDYEELRGRILRRLREELSLLDEGLHALRRDPPKVHVMEDHAERAIDGLKHEMEQLKKSDVKGDD
jgi:predicted  nucleic acid-binding Zn-ribbon protein